MFHHVFITQTTLQILFHVNGVHNEVFQALTMVHMDADGHFPDKLILLELLDAGNAFSNVCHHALLTFVKLELDLFHF